MNAVVTTEAISPETLEHVLGTGDISKLSVPQRVEFYQAACRSLNLNPLTRPIRFLTFQGQMQAYFTRDGTDQLRRNNRLSLNVVDKSEDDGVYVVTVRAKTPEGREDEDIGAVTVAGLKGDARANALMKCTTKAKRRVTLSICGLGWPSEDELDTMRGVRTFDAEDHDPHDASVTVNTETQREAINRAVPIDAPPMKAAAATMQRAPRKTEPVARTDEQWKVWVEKLRAACAVLYTRQDVVEIGNRPSVGDAIATGPDWVRRDVSAILAENYARFPEPEEAAVDDDPFAPGVEIQGAEKLAAG